MKKSFLLFVVVFLSFSCVNDKYFEVNQIVKTKSVGQLLVDSTSQDCNILLKKEFANALAKVLFESRDVRGLIKNEALKRINFDYDVLYYLVKDRMLENGLTLEKLMLKYLDAEVLNLVTEKIPTLTIFVPELPEESFSAELWNIDTEIPVVGVRTTLTNDVPVFDANGNESVIEAYLIPGYPIVVIKENERIVTNDKITKSMLQTSPFSAEAGNVPVFRFLDEAFDNISSKNHIATTRAAVSDDNSKLFEAYDIFPNETGWQRDYVYYNITPANPQGPFNYNFKEHLVSFELLGDPKGVLSKIADQTSDPRLDGKWHENYVTPDGTRVMTGWTDGEFEFTVRVYYGSKNSAGNELITNFRVKPSSIFKTELTSSQSNKKTYQIKSMKLKKIPLSVPLFEWNIENYSSTIKIVIEEYDPSETIQKKEDVTHEFATNFNFDITFGQVVKKGLKFGATQKLVTVTSCTVTEIKESDKLGEVLVNFADPILLSKNIITVIINGTGGRSDSYTIPDYNNKYSTGFYRIQIAPKK